MIKTILTLLAIWRVSVATVSVPKYIIQLCSKKILKAAYADVLPVGITKRRKAGFGMPLRSLLSKREVLDQLMPYDALESTGEIDMDKLRKLEEAHISGKQDQSALIYALVICGTASKTSQS